MPEPLGSEEYRTELLGVESGKIVRNSQHWHARTASARSILRILPV